MNSAPWDTAYALYDDIDEILSYNNSLIESTCREHILHKTVTIRTNDKPLMSHEVRYFFRRRDRFFKKFKRKQTTTDKLNFNIARREANTAKRNAIKRYEQKLVNKLSQDHLDVKTFWKLSKNIQGCKSDRSIPPLYENGQIIPDDLSKATLFNNDFASISSFTENVIIPDLPNFEYLTDTRLDRITTNENEVESLLRRINTNKSSGLDGIGNWVLKHCAESLSFPYSKLFNKSLETGIFPSQWKQANVCPVFKKDNKSDKTNYRPISLLSSSSKILEKIVYKRLYEYLMDNNLLIEQNSGFKRKDSTVNQLLKIVHQIYQDIKNGKDTCLVFLDVSKAFDKVWHKGLLFKLRQLGIVGTLYDWI